MTPPNVIVVEHLKATGSNVVYAEWSSDRRQVLGFNSDQNAALALAWDWSTRLHATLPVTEREIAKGERSRVAFQSSAR